MAPELVDNQPTPMKQLEQRRPHLAERSIREKNETPLPQKVSFFKVERLVPLERAFSGGLHHAARFIRPRSGRNISARHAPRAAVQLFEALPVGVLVRELTI